MIDTFANRQANAYGAIFLPKDGSVQQVADGTNWYNILGGVPLIEPPAVATLATQVNFGTSTMTKANGIITFKPQLGTSPTFRGAGKAIVTLASAVVTAAAAQVSLASTTLAAVGVYMRESGTGKILSWELQSSSVGSSQFFTLTTWTSSTAIGATNGSEAALFSFRNGCPVILKLSVSGANYLAQVSIDGGVNFVTLATAALTVPFTVQPNEFGIHAHVVNNVSAMTCSFFTLAFAGD